MLLKKQTVWLLTMLSLVVVLSVYYITTPEDLKTENAQTEEQGNEAKNDDGIETSTDEEKEDDVKIGEDEEGNVISQISSDDVFSELRMQIDEQRSKEIEVLEDMVANAELSTDAKMEAYEKIQDLKEVKSKEQIIETLIKGKNYEDVLVRVEGDKVKITVKAEEQSPQAANDILRIVRSEIGDHPNMTVTFDHSGK